MTLMESCYPPQFTCENENPEFVSFSFFVLFLINSHILYSFIIIIIIIIINSYKTNSVYHFSFFQTHTLTLTLMRTYIHTFFLFLFYSLSLYIYIYIYVCMYVFLYIYISLFQYLFRSVYRWDVLPLHALWVGCQILWLLLFCRTHSLHQRYCRMWTYFIVFILL